jgi:allophanate hydrolase subunit 2
VLGSASTYAPAGLGGFEGRALDSGDRLSLSAASTDVEPLKTPECYRPKTSKRRAMRVCDSAETHLLTGEQRTQLYSTNWTVGRRADRMGVALDGGRLDMQHDGRMPSVPVFPGTIQCPTDGAPYLLGIDAGTTGGYPRIAQVARVDRHMIGQLRPGDHLALLPRSPSEALAELKALHDYWRPWLPGIEAVI